MNYFITCWVEHVNLTATACTIQYTWYKYIVTFLWHCVYVFCELTKWAACVPMFDYVDTHVYINGSTFYLRGPRKRYGSYLHLWLLISFGMEMWCQSAQPKHSLELIFWCLIFGLDLIWYACGCTHVHSYLFIQMQNFFLPFKLFNLNLNRFNDRSQKPIWEKKKKKEKQQIFKFIIFSLTNFSIECIYCIWIG